MNLEVNCIICILFGKFLDNILYHNFFLQQSKKKL